MVVEGSGAGPPHRTRGVRRLQLRGELLPPRRLPVWNMLSVLTRPELQEGAGDRSYFDEPRFSRDRMRAAVWSGSSATSLMERNSWMYASPRPLRSTRLGASQP